ncbi:Ribosome biosis protein BRX1-like [Hondaea fermentalgiana]|uniref:Ribosome biosis protein BRX1-like n=1 Tax=Hondaea fermentalgiana TaxID=2315210 RepID=A0A2R5GVY8_9STRA|nr:Ribosome biosis protein BRX1-like [Hondaea fermentalgiana]|eukprot:GBG34735.1 Ribosome biosis protein BRX1-like [Hondaea fermentalgiana]
MKRKLSKGAATERRRSRRVDLEDMVRLDGVKGERKARAAAKKTREELDQAKAEADAEAEAYAKAGEEDLASSEDSESEAEGEDLEADESEEKVKGSLSKRDQEVMRERNAELDRVANIVPYRNKQRVLIFCSRGITSRFRHLMDDMRSLLPHHRREIKHDTKRNLHEINEVCELKGCNNCLFFEARKRKDLYMWLSKTPNGPSVKFHVLNIHTMDELRLSGNCLKGARPLLSFANEFDVDPTLQLIKELFTQIFGTPRGHPKSKPFVDHVMNFSLLDGKIWFRHFQIVDTTQDAKEIRRALKRGEETVKLVEIGPRFVLDLIKVFDGSFGGRTLVENPAYVTPSAERSEIMKGRGSKYAARVQDKVDRAARSEVNVLPHDPVREVFRS